MWQKYYLWTFCIGLELCVTISNVALKFAQCDPAPALWDPRVAGTCIDPLVMAHYGIFYGGRFGLTPNPTEHGKLTC